MATKGMDWVVGRRVLGEVEEMSLQEVLDEFRATVAQSTTDTDTAAAAAAEPGLHPVITKRLKPTSLASLDRLAARHAAATHSAHVAVAGRGLPLLHALVGRVASTRRAVLVVDLEGRFDATRLACAAADLRHVYVQRGRAEDVRALVDHAERWMLYGAAAAPGGPSAGREWWGTVVVGGGGGLAGPSGVSSAGDVSTSWRGWMRVDRTSVSGFAYGASAEEARARRDARQEVVDGAGWTASSPWGGFVFYEDGTEGGG